MPNDAVIRNFDCIVQTAERAFRTTTPEEAINLLYPLAKLHASLVKAKVNSVPEQLLALLTTQSERIAESLEATPAFDRHASVHQWFLLHHYLGNVNKIPPQKK